MTTSCKIHDAIYCVRRCCGILVIASGSYSAPKDENCQASDWKNHKKVCQAARKALSATKNSSLTNIEPATVKAVDVTGGHNMPFCPIAVEISADHEIFNGKGVLSPVSKLIGHPILIYRHLQDEPLNYLFHPRREHFDNQSVTYLMIDPETTVAPPRWQQGIGRVTVVRQDKKPLSSLNMEKLWAYCYRILDGFDYRGGPPRHRYSPDAYEKWAKNYSG
ncbi:hypothetical protein SCHPADRAFT_879660 [Schizopora paradoxa]|uniref:MYND-type domain-containing protein n=1 Tax=Schizopora paradoxa TaxID=27342 RepID=A0A0H2RWI2_9AGAM|nr:hypothetical protein SCHPADRAFT_879660 [Schizopora paradoxa]